METDLLTQPVQRETPSTLTLGVAALMSLKRLKGSSDQNVLVGETPYVVTVTTSGEHDDYWCVDVIGSDRDRSFTFYVCMKTGVVKQQNALEGIKGINAFLGNLKFARGAEATFVDADVLGLMVALNGLRTSANHVYDGMRILATVEGSEPYITFNVSSVSGELAHLMVDSRTQRILGQQGTLPFIHELLIHLSTASTGQAATSAAE